MSKTTKKRIYAEINKVEEQEDGTLKVSGIASTASVDSDGETVTAECMRAAIPDYMKFGAVREMHQPSAAGTALEISVDDAGVTQFSALVVDAEAIKKVQTGVYKGFSIGGKVTERDALNKKIIKGLNLIEISLVDRPANPDAKISMYKAASTQEDDVEELAELLDSGAITPAALVELARKAITVEDKPAEVATVTPHPPQGGVGGTGADTTKAEQTTTPAADTVQKSMWDIGGFARCLQELAYLAACSEQEMQWEGDGSPVPEAMRVWLADGVAIFKAMATEEADEMLRSLGAMTAQADVIEYAAKAGLVKMTTGEFITKAGARFSKATKASLDKMRASMKEAEACLADLKYDVEEAEEAASKAATNDDTDGSTNTEPVLEKSTKTEVVLKAEDLSETINKALAPLQDQITKVSKENETLKAQLEAVGKRAAPGKALLKVMSKGQDLTDTTTDQPEAVVPPEGTPERAQYEMKKVFSNGGTRMTG